MPVDLVSLLQFLSTITPVLLLALVGFLGTRFATREDIKGLGERLTATETIARAANDAALLAQSKAEDVESLQAERWDRTLRTIEQVSAQMQDVSRGMQALQKEQASTAGIVAPLVRDVERLFKKVDGGRP